MDIRLADLAGSWYPGHKRELAEEVEKCLLQAEMQYQGAEEGRKPVAAVAPHAGLAFSGPLAAAAYRAVRDAIGTVDTFVIFGACHRAFLSEPAIWNRGAWETPLGAIQIDGELADIFVAEDVGTVNFAPHHGDNAIELQTPFIKHMFPDAKIVPIAVSSRPDSWRRGEIAAKIARERGGTVIAIASTDLTHYGASFGVMPAGVGEPALAWMRKNDQRFLQAVAGMRLDDIVRIAEKDGSACGGGAAAAAAGWAREFGSKSGRLLGYTNSHEIMPRGIAEHIVGYAALVFEIGKTGKNGIYLKIKHTH